VNESDSQQGASFDRELNRRIVRGSAWVGLGYGGGQILTLVSTLVLVRLLDPEAFGIVAVGMTLLAVITQIQESGLGSAFVHIRHRDPRVAAASVFVFAAVAGLVLTASMVVLAPVYTGLLRVPESTEYVQVLALMIAIRGLTVVPGAMLERALNFRARTQAELAGSVVQATTSIACAVGGLGAWSLVAGLLAGSATQGAGMWLRAPWRPSPVRASWSTLRELLRYGRFVSGANVMVVINANVDSAVVARSLGAGSLGFYSIAWRLAGLPATVIGVIVGRVMFSVYSRLQHDLAAARAAYVQNMQRTMLFALPISAALGLAAEPIVLGLLGSEWSAAIGPLRVLAIFGLVRLLVSPSGDLFRGIGRPHLTLISTIVFFVVSLPALLVLVPWLGPTGAAWAMVAGILATGALLMPLTFHALSLRPTELALALARPAACAGIVAVALLATLPAAEALGALPALGLVAGVATSTFLVSIALLGRPLLIPIWAGLRRT
jgi:lipopolysaccharide exporter